MAYAQRLDRGSSSTTSNVFNRYPSSLSSACALQPRPTAGYDQDSDNDEGVEEEEADGEGDGDSSGSMSGCSEDEEDMMLDSVIHSGNVDYHHLGHQPRQASAPTATTRSSANTTTVNVLPPRLHLSSADVPQRPRSHQPATVTSTTSVSAAAPPAPIIVTYGPFHSPDVDVAVAYGQMVCYLWFWSPSNPNSSTPFDAAAWSLQLQPHPHFIHFLSKVITQTQLSKTVLVLALHYLWLLKRPVMVGSDADEAGEDMGPINRPSALATAPGDGSQYTVSVIALMLANKFMDDNTYTNKSWAAICGVTLEKINSMEREFLIAINHALHVDVNRFMSWIRIMQSFFVQRQSRFDSRSRRVVRLPHSQSPHHQPYSHPHDNSYSYPQHSGSNVHRRAQSRSRLNIHSDDGHTQSDGNGNAVSGYAAGRARSVSPKIFQFTFVPPVQPQHHQQQPTQSHHSHSQIADNSLNVPSSNSHAHPSYDHQNQRPFTGDRPRPYTGSYAIRSSSNSASSSSRTPAQWFNPNVNSSIDMSSTTTPGMIEPSPILVNVPSSRSKRSASQAFSPRTAEPPRPRPDDRQAPQALFHPHPVRRVRPHFVNWHSQPHTLPHQSNLYPHHQQQQQQSHVHHPQLTSYPSHSHQPVRRMNQVHEILATSRPSTAVEAGFARMSLSSHGPSPVSDSGPARPHLYSVSSHSRSQLSLQNHSHSQSHLAAPFDPYTAPTFRNEGAREDEPLRLQYYQLVQGGRGVLHCQPMVDVGMQVPSQGEAVHESEISPRGYEYAARDRNSMYPPSLAFSTPTDDDEGMSSSESSNGTGWEYQHSHLHPQQQQLRPQPQPQSQQQSQVVGGGYSLPPLSTLLAETQQYASPAPSLHVQPTQTPVHDNVKYAEFANAGPPATYAPQWGLFHSPSEGQLGGSYPQHGGYPSAFQSNAGVEMSMQNRAYTYGRPAQQNPAMPRMTYRVR